MSEGRMISAKIFKDDFVGNLSYFERLVWLGLIVACADDQGRCLDNAKLIDAEIFPYDDVSKEKINLVLDNFVQVGKIIRYEAKNQRLIQIVNWWKNQRPNWAGRSIYTAPNGWVDRIHCHSKGNVIITENWNKAGGLDSTQDTPQDGPQDGREGKDDGKGKDEVKDEAEVEVSASDSALPETLLNLLAATANLNALKKWGVGENKKTRAIAEDPTITPEIIEANALRLTDEKRFTTGLLITALQCGDNPPPKARSGQERDPAKYASWEQ